MVITGCKSAKNISDDILIWGREEHDNNLREVLSWIKSSGSILTNASSVSIEWFSVDTYYPTSESQANPSKIASISEINHPHQSLRSNHFWIWLTFAIDSYQIMQYIQSQSHCEDSWRKRPPSSGRRNNKPHLTTWRINSPYLLSWYSTTLLLIRNWSWSVYSLEVHQQPTMNTSSFRNSNRG